MTVSFRVYPLWLRTLVCRLVGHKTLRAVIYEVGRARVGEGCTRCRTGTVHEYRCQYPVPKR